MVQDTSVNDVLEFPISKRIVPNRLIKASLTEGLADPNQSQPNQHHWTLYSTWCKGGYSMIFTGNVMIDREHRESVRNVVLDEDSHLQDFSQWADAIHGSTITDNNHDNDNKIKPLAIMQISHPGRQCPMACTRMEITPVSCTSGTKARLALPGLLGQLCSYLLIRPARELAQTDELATMVQRYAKTAQLAEQAGWDGVEIHGAHGYLLSQFLSPTANHRTDDYGGTAKGRRKLLLQVIAAVRQVTSPTFVVGVKINTKDRSTEGVDRETECLDLIQELCDLEQLDFIELSGGGFEDAMFIQSPPPTTTQQQQQQQGGGWLFGSFAQRMHETIQWKKKSPKIILTGGFRTKTGMEHALRTGLCDMIGLGRPSIANPMFANDVLEKDQAEANLVSLQVPIFKQLLESVLNNLWYQRQLYRLSIGKSPDPNLSYLYALVLFFSVYIWDFGFRGHAAYKEGRVNHTHPETKND